MMSSCFAIASHLDNFDLKCVILSKGGLCVFSEGNNMGGFFVAWVLLFFLKKSFD